MKYDKKAMGARIAGRRKARKIKQSDLAEILEISNNHLSAIETGKENPSIETLLKICDALQVTPDYLLLGTMHANNISANIMDGLRLCSPEDQALLTDIVELMVKRNGKIWNDENYI